MKRVTIHEIEQITFALTKKLYTYDEPIPDFGTRFPNILESCLAAPFITFGGKELYPDFISKVSILFYLMVKNHPFKNGNKRIAVTTLFYALSEENKWLSVSNTVLYNFAMFIALSPADAKDEMIDYIKKFIKTNLTNY